MAENSAVAVAQMGRLKSIDALRGGAALAVVFHHAVNAGAVPPATATWYPGLSAFADYGRQGVALFFVLSGFCIHARWAQRKAGGQDTAIAFLPFWKRRLFRLYPPYLVALVLSMGLVLAAYFRHANVPLVTSYPEPRLPWIGADFVAHFFMLHGLYPVFDRAGGNAPFWTLAREEYFYLMYFALLAFRRRLGPWGALGVVTVIGLVFPLCFKPFLAPDSPWWQLIESSSITLWAQWTLGFVAVEGYQGIITLPKLAKAAWLVPVWALLGIAVHPYAPDALSPLFWGLAFFTLLNVLVERERAGKFGVSAFPRWLARVGVFSYSIYLVHHPVRGLMKRLLDGVIQRGDALTFGLAVALICVAGYVAGRVFFALVERRFILAPLPRAK